ncbi:uncharacterized protein GGS25DRAFT_522174 [Hypoxylon fragiforme]|uniref:uncharacterized protein n=1 Tax=Hypoxylon fragiforme TaxID=63214 RepID=UPI0020C71F14|nr:uncharacterized protein GGS25DRAFT_522174 [Hypoxylon fragiforme]KAI2608993.1 hypothetical protein GGS25DRAFT_522174 [Hypoxylon fragiforme]
MEQVVSCQRDTEELGAGSEKHPLQKKKKKKRKNTTTSAEGHLEPLFLPHRGVGLALVLVLVLVLVG